MIRITLRPSAPVQLPLRLRVPAWIKDAVVKVNRNVIPSAVDGGWFKIDRTWVAGDTVDLHLPMPRVSVGYHDSVSLDRGPLAFSFPIGEDWVKLRTRGMTAGWQVFPTTQWNYAVGVGTDPSQRIAVEEWPIGGAPFSLTGAPVRLKLPARTLPAWRAEDGVANPVPQSSVHSDEPEETIVLVPHGAVKLHITAFPRLKA